MIYKRFVGMTLYGNSKQIKNHGRNGISVGPGVHHNYCGGFSQYVLCSSRKLGKMEPMLTLRIFFQMGGLVQPPTRQHFYLDQP